MRTGWLLDQEILWDAAYKDRHYRILKDKKLNEIKMYCLNTHMEPFVVGENWKMHEFIAPSIEKARQNII